jgi:hypothetical protein
MLGAQLANGRKKTDEAKKQTDEWMEKYQRLKDRLQNLMGDA